ncbi:MAG TPA: GHMP kinase [Actinomycetes bacterium]|nr:GHMP kinase [Actinomycetes bacterium]
MRTLGELDSAPGRRGDRAREIDVGVGYAPAHHGEFVQGVFDDGSGRLRRALITLPDPGRGSRAVFFPSERHLGIVGTPELIKVRRAAILALREFSGHPSPAKGGQIEITSNVPRGIGMGSSTSDVAATIRAVADYHRVPLSREEVGRLAVLAECASDSVMIDDRVVLFAHREGVVLETFGHRLPPMVVVGCDTAPGAVVDTLAFPPAEYRDAEVGAFQVLRAAFRRAVVTEDVALLGRVATASARINQRFLPKPALEALLELCRRLGGCGVQVAHSGTVAGLIFDPARPGVDESVRECVAGITALGLEPTGVIGPAPAAAPIGPLAARVPA